MESKANHGYKIGIPLVALMLFFVQVQFAHAQTVFNGHMNEALYND